MRDRVLIGFCLVCAFMLVGFCVMFVSEACRMQREHDNANAPVRHYSELSMRRLEKIRKINMGVENDEV
jgi:hypothetical protein